jgi:glutathione S-transferase
MGVAAMQRVLVHLPQSPWSEKARWALDHHGVPYKLMLHVPMIYEPVLRIWARDLRQKITVPILFEGSRAWRDSLTIAEHAEELGRGAPLFPRSHVADVIGWNEVSERILRAGRARAMERMLQNTGALVEALPPPLRKGGALLAPMAKMGAKFVMGKHVQKGVTAAEYEAAMTSGLEQAERALDGGDYLAGNTFTFADVAICCALGAIKPHPRLAIGPETRAAFTEEKIAAAFPSLLAWRDRVIERHR